MDVVSSKIANQVESILDREVCEVLLAESDDLVFGNKEGELILAGVAQLAELDAANLSSNAGSELVDLAIVPQKVLEGRVGVFAVLVMGVGFERRAG